MIVLVWLGILFLVLLNAAFVAAEFALVRVRREKLEGVETEKTRSASFALRARGSRLALRALNHLDDSLATCQLGITMTSIAIGFLGVSAANMVSPSFYGTFGATTALVLTPLVVYFLVVAIHISVGEQIPKLYAAQKPETAARFLAGPMLAFYTLARPAILLLTSVTKVSLRLLGVRGSAKQHEEELPSTAELDVLISRSHLAGRIDEGEAHMLAGVLDLQELTAEQVVTPIFEVDAVTQEDSLRKALECCHDSGHSRLLVLEREYGAAVGVVHIADLAWTLAKQGANARVSRCMRPIHVVPESKPLNELLAEMQRERISLALVAGEYGRPVGIVTVEDIVEQIVGKIADETDQEDPLAEMRQPDGSLLLPGHTSLHERGLPEWPDVQDSTIGGLVFSLLGHLPAVGEETEHEGYTLTVTEMHDHRVAQVRITPVAEAWNTDEEFIGA